MKTFRWCGKFLSSVERIIISQPGCKDPSKNYIFKCISLNTWTVIMLMWSFIIKDWEELEIQMISGVFLFRPRASRVQHLQMTWAFEAVLFQWMVTPLMRSPGKEPWNNITTHNQVVDVSVFDNQSKGEKIKTNEAQIRVDLKGTTCWLYYLNWTKFDEVWPNIAADICKTLKLQFKWRKPFIEPTLMIAPTYPLLFPLWLQFISYTAVYTM